MTGLDLREWRNRTGYSQIELAKALGVTNVCISRWETGDRQIPSFLSLALGKLECEGVKRQGKKTKKEKGVKDNG